MRTAAVRVRRRPARGAQAAPDELWVGQIVYDRHYDMPARITGVQGSVVFLARPTGLAWHTSRVAVRPATAWEQRQLAALAKLHRQRQRGLDIPT
ncbi:hypothetical protein ACWD4G_21935 [Streptomyces sp. NPDC002643]